jgi:hypothetical protein
MISFFIVLKLILFSGLGKYFVHAYPEVKLTWQEHIEHLIVFCTIHFQRGIDQLPESQNSPKYRLRKLLSCDSKEQCYALLDYVIANVEEYRHWALHKRTSWILAGLNKHCSKMSFQA